MTYADFNHVDPKHAVIDGRLINWARWAVTNTRSFVQPCFRLYRSEEHWDEERMQKPDPIDPIDAMKMEKGVRSLPEKHATSIRWCYIDRTKPVRLCRALGVNQLGLADLIWQGRVMLLNRRV